MFESILAALGSVIDVVTILIFAISLGFSAMPASIGFSVSAAFMLIFGQVSPVAVLTEDLVLINKFSQDKNERAGIVLISGSIIFLLGVTGLIGKCMDFVGDIILSGIMSGVGIILFRVSFGMILENKLAGGLSVAIGVIVYLLTQSLVYTTILCVLISALVWDFVNRDTLRKLPAPDLSAERFRFHKPVFNLTVIRGSLALSTLLFGSVISDGSITATLAGIKANSNALSIYVGLSNLLGSLFGTPPIGNIASATGSTPMPLFSGVLMMILLVILIVFRVVPRMAKYIPGQSVAGVLCVLGAFIVLPSNAQAAFGAQPLVATAAMLVTAFVDPFFGMCSGVLMRFLIGILPL